MKDGVVYPELSYKINGLCFKVHNDLGRFRTEQSYADAFEEELKKQALPISAKYVYPLPLRGSGLDVTCRISS